MNNRGMLPSGGNCVKRLYNRFIMSEQTPTEQGAMVLPSNATRDPAYLNLLQSLSADQCPLDPDLYYELTPPEDVLHQMGGWVLAKAKSPYANTEPEYGHLMTFPERHIITPDEMTAEDERTFFKMLRVSRDDFGASTGAVAMRYSMTGNHAAVGSTLSHLHAHIIVPELDPETGRIPGHDTGNATPVLFKIG